MKNKKSKEQQVTIAKIEVGDIKGDKQAEKSEWKFLENLAIYLNLEVNANENFHS